MNQDRMLREEKDGYIQREKVRVFIDGGKTEGYFCFNIHIMFHTRDVENQVCVSFAPRLQMFI